MSTTQPQIVPALPSHAENSTPAEAPRSISLERPSPADSTDQFDGGALSAPGDAGKRRDTTAGHSGQLEPSCVVANCEGRGQRTLTTKPDLTGSNGALEQTERPLGQRKTGPIERGKELAPNGSHKPVEQGAIPCPAPNDNIPDDQLTTRSAMRLRLRELVRRMVALSERIAADGISREELATPVQEGDPCSM